MAKTKTIKIKKIVKAIKVAYRVDNEQAQELMPMFMNMRKAA